MASTDLLLKPLCSGCGSNKELYGSNCKHMTLCLTCGKTMAENKGKCYQCGATVTRLIREYNVRASEISEKKYFIGRFATGLPNFSKKKSAENKWSLQKEGLQGRQITDTLKEKFKNKPWLLEDETGQSQYHGPLEGASSATYYLLMLQDKEFVATPAGQWYNFNKVAQYKQLTLEEAEEKIKNRRRTADGYERWMMKAANNGPSVFGEASNYLDKEVGIVSGGNSGRGRKKSGGGDDDVKEEKGDEEEEGARKSRPGPNGRGGEDDEDEAPQDDFDDDDDIEKGDDWEHEEIFTDDDEAVGLDPEEREDLAPELPAPPEIKDDDDDEENENEEEGEKLSKSGKELKKLLGRANGLNDSEAEDDDDSDDLDDEDRPSPAVAPKAKEAVKEEPVDNSPAKTVPGGSSKATPPSKSAKGKRKLGDEVKTTSAASTKKVKTETDTKPSTKDEAPKASAVAKGSVQPPAKLGTGSAQGPVSEDEIRAVLSQRAPITTQELVGNFRARLRSGEDKKAFAEILKRISKIQKTNGQSYVVSKIPAAK